MSRKKKIPKASKKRLAVFGTLSVIIIFYFVFQLFFYTYRIFDLKQQSSKNDQNYKSLKAEEKELRNTIDMLQDSDYIARYVREEYSYSKNGEYIIKLNEEESKEEDITFVQAIKNFVSNINLDYQYIIIMFVGIIILVIVITSKVKEEKKNKNKHEAKTRRSK